MKTATKPRSVNHGRLLQFMYQYRVQLRTIAAANPAEYGWYRGPESADIVADKMEAAFISGSYNHDGKAIKATCKALGVKYTRTAIELYLTAAES